MKKVKRIKTRGPDRLEYLDQLVVEFQKTKSKDCKRQILANLGNFAYDSGNYEYFRQLKILDLFLDHLDDSDEELVKFSIAGICNACLDPLNKDYIKQNNGVSLICNCLKNSDESILSSVITSLMFLFANDRKPVNLQDELISKVLNIKQNFTSSYLKNLCEIFLLDYCDNVQMIPPVLLPADLPIIQSTSTRGLSVGENVTVKRTITKDDVDRFSSLSGDTNVVHNHIVHGALLNSILSSVIGTQLPGHGTVVVSQVLNFPKPCLINDEVTVNVEVLSVRKIINVSYKLSVESRNEIVMYGEAKLKLNKS